MQIIIAGGGKVGAHRASQLCADGESVTVIESDQRAVERLRRACPDCAVVEASASDPRSLERAGVHMADALAAVTGDDEVNLVIAMLAKMEFAAWTWA